MARWHCNIGARSHEFNSLGELMAKATPHRSGDELAGVAASSAEERVAAQFCLADVPLKQFLDEPLVPAERDEVTRLILDQHDVSAFATISSLTVGQFRDWLLQYETDSAALANTAPGITPEMAAAAAKLMSNQDLILVARKCRVVTTFRCTIGLPGRLSVRLQPNHPTDDLRGISASILDGLLQGCGDAVIGINPATESVSSVAELLRMLDDVIGRYAIPTQSCVLGHITTQMEALNHGAPVDLLFQSIAGTELANKSFGVNLALLAEAQQAALALKRGVVGNHVMYFETGQGSALSAGANHGLDQQTCEARAYAVARQFQPLLVNTVVGFIGPEYLYDSKQIIRAGLEDHFCGKLLGLPMGVDVCHTNHAEADKDDLDTLLTLLGVAGCNYIMGIPGADDIMLGYQSTSFHDSHYLRQVLGLRPAPEFEKWLQAMRITGPTGRLQPIPGSHKLLDYAKPGAETASNTLEKAASRPDTWSALTRFTSARIALGRAGGSWRTETSVEFRLAHAQARDAVAKEFSPDFLEAQLRQTGYETVRLSTVANSHAQFLKRPDLGRTLSEDSRRWLIQNAVSWEGRHLALMVSDGLSAQAAERQAAPTLAKLIPLLVEAGWTLFPIFVVPFARVKLQDEVGALLRARHILTLIGERPGLGSPDSLGAYFVYQPGPDKTDADRNCVSNIRPEGLPPSEAGLKLAQLLIQSEKQGRSGIGLKKPASSPNLLG